MRRVIVAALLLATLAGCSETLKRFHPSTWSATDAPARKA